MERTTFAGFVDVLVDTLLAFKVHGYEARIRVKERKHPKLYWVDNGIARAARGDMGAVAAEERGALFESWVAGILRAHSSYRADFEELHYWAPTEAKGIEVDFLIKRSRELMALEAKAGARLRPEWFKGLRAIAGIPGLKRRALVYGGRDSLRTEDGIDVLTMPEFLEEVADGKLFGGRRR